MTLLETIKAVETVAAAQPAINMIVRNDIFRLNTYPDAKYGVFGWTQGQHSASAESGLVSFSFTFFYIDRLTEDKGNQIEVQSVGVQTLDNIIRALNDGGIIIADDWNFTTFNQRFLDECAGVYTSVTLQVPLASICSEDFTGETELASFSDDYNEDFTIY